MMEWDNLQRLLNTYEKGSRQSVNKQKSSLFFSSNTRDHCKDEVLQEVGGIMWQL